MLIRLYFELEFLNLILLAVLVEHECLVLSAFLLVLLVVDLVFVLETFQAGLAVSVELGVLVAALADASVELD